MKDSIKILKEHLPREVAEALSVKRFSPGETVIGFEEKSIACLQKGFIITIAPLTSREYIYPYRFKPGDILGFYSKFFLSASPGLVEYRALTEVEVVLFPEHLVRKYLMTSLETYSLLTESAFKSTENITLSFFIQLHGGARALLAYMLVEYSYNDEYPFIKYENIAKSLSISRSRLYKLEEEFTSKGFIRKERKRIVILDREGLKKQYLDITFSD